jgi:L-serine dehydratase
MVFTFANNGVYSPFGLNIVKKGCKMYYSLSEIFAIGIGPSSSHTVGPMKAACRFVKNLDKKIQDVASVDTYLYGSLALTGVGHGTLNAIVYGLLGFEADQLDLSKNYIEALKTTGQLVLGKKKLIKFDMKTNIILEKKIFLKEHSNGMKFVAKDRDGNIILEETYFSIGGGSIVRQDEFGQKIERKPLKVPYQFSSFSELRDICNKNNMSIKDVVLANEFALAPKDKVLSYIKKIIKIMQDNITRGISTEGTLPGSLKLHRRAPSMHKSLQQRFENNFDDSLYIIDWVNIWAFAVAE